MSHVQVTHVIDNLGDGGAAGALLASAMEWGRLTGGCNSIISLLPASRSARVRAREMGARLVEAPPHDVLGRALSDADIVHIHFYNSPTLFRVLASRLPPCRLLIWSHIGGGTAPHFLTDRVIDLADRLAVTAPRSLALPAVERRAAKGDAACVVIGGADFSRLDGLKPLPHAGFNVGYIGTADPVKIHPDFVAMCTRIDVPDVRFVICGAQAEHLRRQVAGREAAARFEFRGFVSDIRPVLACLDVFGYPLCPDTYATSDQALQEAMFAGVPPVVFPYGGIRDMVRHNATGLVVDSPGDYVAAIDFLARHPKERARLGRNAKAHAAGHFGAVRSARQFDAIYRAMMSRPKREQADPVGPTRIDGDCALSGTELFLLSLAGRMPEFEISAAGAQDPETRTADRTIANASAAVEAVVRQYLACNRTDPTLAMWAGLIDRRNGRQARALISFRRALAGGGDVLRLKGYIDEVARDLGASEEAIARTSAAAATEVRSRDIVP